MEEHLKDFYLKNLEKHGASAEGVGWKNKEAQMIRFEQLSKLFNRTSFTVNDLGCGVGDFLTYAIAKFPDLAYMGYDVMPDMLAAANSKYGHWKNASFRLINDAQEMLEADYTVASGIFNIRFQHDDEAWRSYILNTVSTMKSKSKLGFSFNILTKYSDAEFMKPELYYADPCALFDYCKRNFSRNVALLHDYNQYDFTIIVRKDI